MDKFGRFIFALIVAIIVTVGLALLLRAPYFSFMVVSVIVFTGFIYLFTTNRDSGENDADRG